MNLGPGKEFDRVRGILARIAEITGEVPDLGDDCALLPLGSTTLAISIDNSLENVHFRTDWLDFKEIGCRAAGAALADLAAEGAKPLGLMVSLGAPPNEQGGSDPAAEIMAGVATLARRTRRQRDDRHLRRTGFRCAAPRRRVRGRHRDPPRADPMLGGCGSDGGGRQR